MGTPCAEKITGLDVSFISDISSTKIAPSFGSQTIVGQKVQITDAGSPTLEFLDTNAGPDYKLINADGVFGLYDETNGAYRAQVQTDGHIDLKTNVDCEAGLDVTGNITVTGSVDGVDVSAFNTQAQSFFNNNGNGVLTNGVTATTQSASDNSTKVATTAYTDTAISNLVDSSPGALNTLNELAAAINDDASFSTTVNNNIATKLPLSGGTVTGQLNLSQTSGDVLNFNGSSSDSSRGISFNSKTALSYSNDNWLRINNDSEFTNGVYTPGVIRADGGINVDGATTINGDRTVVASK